MVASAIEIGMASAVAIMAVSASAAPSAAELGRDAAAPGGRLSLWYRQPAKAWERQALPVGNGRLGGMVFGGVKDERVQLNEDTVWAGPPVPENRAGAASAIAEARKLFFEGKYTEGQAVIQENVMSERISPRSYQTLGDLHLSFAVRPGPEAYRRELNLDTAIASTTFVQDGIRYTREVFATPVDDVLVLRLSADKPGQITVTVGLDRPGDFETTATSATTLAMSGRAAHGAKHPGVWFDVGLRAVLEGGTSAVEGRSLSIRGADAVTLLLAAYTDYNMEEPFKPLTRDRAAACAAQLDRAAAKPFGQLRGDHVREHQRLFRRVELSLGAPVMKPTDERLAAVKSGGDDPDLVALYFQYGRYLLISCSRPGCMPSNLQGLWNDKLEAPWNSDYHININIQMDYWPAEVCNLSECHDPFFALTDRLLGPGRKTAREVYACRGFVAHHTTDAWWHTAPFGKAQYGMWPLGAAWCTQHFMEHYRFTGDETFLRERAWPVLREASLFFLDWLVENPHTGKLVGGPSTSPENAFKTPSGERCCLSMGCSMDQEIVWDTFSNLLEAAGVLGVDDGVTKAVRGALERLARPGIGADGRLMEWAEPFAEPEPGHRHMSHLFGVYPGREFTPKRDPARLAAARKSIEYRLAHGGGHTGWSRAWIINFRARFRDAEQAYDNVLMLLKKSTGDNLFDLHPPFQIDGNFGGTAGIAEMLLQSYDDELRLLPALPAAWADGAVRGLKARGGFEIEMVWRGGSLTGASVRSLLGKPCELRYGENALHLETEAGKRYILDGELKLRP